jgi:hypothetical protein
MRYWVEMRWTAKHFIVPKPRATSQENGQVILHPSMGQNPTRVILSAEYQSTKE